MIIEKLILEMGITLVFAMLFGAIMEKYKFPSVLGFILAGILIGPVFHVVHESEILELFSELGVILLLFYIGLELDPEKFKEGGLAAVILGPAKIAINFVLGFLIGALVGWPTLESAMLGFVIMMSSTAIVGKYLIDRGEMHTIEASISITMLLIEDFVAVLILAILGSLQKGQANLPGLVLTSVAIVLVFMYVISEYSKYLMRFIERFEYEKHISLYALGMVFFLSYLVSFFGVSPAIGAFLAGYLIARMGHNKVIKRELGTFRDFFVAFFFVGVGLMFKVPSDLPSYIVILGLLVLANFGKLMSYGAFGKFLGLSTDLSSKVVGLMIPIGEFSLIIASLAFQLKLPHAQGILNAAITLSLATAFLMPYGMKYLNVISRAVSFFPTNKRFSVTGSLIHASKESRAIHRTTVSFFRGVGLYFLAGFSVVYLLVLAGEKIQFTFMGYTSTQLFAYSAVVLLIPVIYGIVLKIRWLGRQLVSLAGPDIFPELKTYHLAWMQEYIADLFAGFTLILIATLMGIFSYIIAREYLILPLLIFLVGVLYTGRGYLTSLESYEKIKRGMRVKKKMRHIGGRLGPRSR